MRQVKLIMYRDALSPTNGFNIRGWEDVENKPKIEDTTIHYNRMSLVPIREIEKRLPEYSELIIVS